MALCCYCRGMKKVFLLPPVLLLLASCGANRETCALAASRQISYEEAGERLGLKDNRGKGISSVVSNYCQYYYKN